MEKVLWEEPLAKADIPSLTLAPTSTLFNLVPDLPTFASTASTSSSPGGEFGENWMLWIYWDEIFGSLSSS